MLLSDFRVIIAGGGPVGLLAALIFRSAGIDFIVLEQRPDVAPDAGLGIILNPATLRIFHQLGLLETFLSVSYELETKSTFTLKGHLADSQTFDILRRNHGCSLHCCRRRDLLHLLYEALGKDKAKVLTEKKLTTIVTRDDGLRVICQDGSSYEGSMVLGADGVHSRTRVMMRNLALAANADPKWADERPFPATWKCFFFSVPSESLKGRFIETQSSGRSVLLGADHESAWVTLFELLPEPTIERISYSPEDMAKYTETFAEFPITESLKIKDLLPKATHSGMVSLEEGFAEQWTWHRIVLAGDACHKFTPNAGLGFNTGAQDLAVLVNCLREALDACPGSEPSSEQVSEALQSYQSLRSPLAKADSFVSWAIARLHSWANTVYYVIARYVLPLAICDTFIYNHLYPRGVRQAAVLEHIAAEEPFSGTLQWDNKMTGSRGRAQ